MELKIRRIIHVAVTESPCPGYFNHPQDILLKIPQDKEGTSGVAPPAGKDKLRRCAGFRHKRIIYHVVSLLSKINFLSHWNPRKYLKIKADSGRMLRKLAFSQTGTNYAVQNKILKKAFIGGVFQPLLTQRAVILDNTDIT
jgi:hypothetical protein